MTKKLFTLCALIAAIVSVPSNAFAVTGSAYPSTVLKNQFGETSINSITGGSVFDCVFTVASTDAAGKGITGLSGNACASVFMHTTQTPASGSPNPAAGYIVVNLKSQFYGFNGAYISAVGIPNPTPTNVTSGVTGGSPYVIATVGTTVASQWVHLGVPSGVTPSPGVGFIAASTTTATGTGTVEAPGTVAGGVSIVDAVGTPALSGQGGAGGQIVLRVAAATSSSVTTLVATAPNDGSVIALHFVLLPLSSQLH